MPEATEATPTPGNTQPISGFSVDSGMKGALVGSIATALLAAVGWWWTTTYPRLKWTSSDVVTFQGEKYKFGLANVSVVNDGSKEAENVTCRLSLGGPTIHEAKVTPEILEPKVTFEGDTVTVVVDTLNAGEDFQLSVITTDSRPVPNRLIPHVRAKGVIGESAANVDKRYSYIYFIISFLFAAALLLAMAVAVEWLRNWTERRTMVITLDPEKVRRIIDERMPG